MWSGEVERENRFHINRKEVKNVTDQEMIALLQERNERGLQEIAARYGSEGRHIAANILKNEADAQEVFQDALMRLWNAIPPEHPENLFAYLCTVVRRLAFNRQKMQNADKRGNGQQPLLLEELSEITDGSNVEETVSMHLLQAAVNRFLEKCSVDARTIFIQRYGNAKAVAEIAALYHISESKVKVTLFRTRKKLQQFLRKEDLL